MQAYNKSFARAYQLLWTDFADRVAPAILKLYAATNAGIEKKPVLDLCCGTGTVALHFLAAGFEVVGVDLSPHMLDIARDNAREYLESGRARFDLADASDYKVEQKFGLVVSTYDALNHLDDLDSMERVFALARTALEPGGLFVFDLNTRLGLKKWDGINVFDGDDHMVMTRGGYDPEAGRAFTRISGFLRGEDGRYDRFQEMVVEHAFDTEEVTARLMSAGFVEVYCARESDLENPVPSPEDEPRVFFVAAG